MKKQKRPRIERKIYVKLARNERKHDKDGSKQELTLEKSNED